MSTVPPRSPTQRMAQASPCSGYLSSGPGANRRVSSRQRVVLAQGERLPSRCSQTLAYSTCRSDLLPRPQALPVNSAYVRRRPTASRSTLTKRPKSPRSRSLNVKVSATLRALSALRIAIAALRTEMPTIRR
jgi:hypothetical protein